jgi:hypothetical protein
VDPELFQTFGMVLAGSGAVAAISWTVLLLQAYFHDRRIALVGLFGSMLAALVYVFLQDAGKIIGLSVGVAAAVLFSLYLLRHIRRPSVYLPALTLLVSSALTIWAYRSLDAMV